ncbi:MAG: hypothetical protein ACLP8S_25795, partial [Solirubrobacteraceae bacterium]
RSPSCHQTNADLDNRTILGSRGGVRHTGRVATDRSPSTAVLPLALDDITLTEARDDLLLIEPIDLGPGAPATAALEVERGRQPTAPRERGTR